MLSKEEIELENLIDEIQEKMGARDLSDDYLREHNNSTREEIGIGEYAYGITMIPCKWVYPFLVKLSASITREDNKDAYIRQLETDKQKLIEKLEEDKKKWQEFHNRVPEVPEYIDYILSFLKGEKHE